MSEENKNLKNSIPDHVIDSARKHGIDLTNDTELQDVIEKVNKGKNLPKEVVDLVSVVIRHFHKIQEQWKAEK